MRFDQCPSVIVGSNLPVQSGFAYANCMRPVRLYTRVTTAGIRWTPQPFPVATRFAQHLRRKETSSSRLAIAFLSGPVPAHLRDIESGQLEIETASRRTQ
jgi:hypothetical protein